MILDQLVFFTVGRLDEEALPVGDYELELRVDGTPIRHGQVLIT